MAPAGSKDRRYYDLAMKVAADSLCDDKHGSVIVKGSRVMVVAANRLATHPTSIKFLKQSIHAEQRALGRLGAAAKGATLYTARKHLNSISKPCCMCESLIKDAGISRVVYSDGKNIIATTVREMVPADGPKYH